MAYCRFIKPDGTPNIVEQDEQGRIRVECLHCHRLYPSPDRPLRLIPNIYSVVGKNCHGPGAPEKIQTKTVALAKNCAESCINRAERAYETMIEQLAMASEKGKAALNEVIRAECDKMNEPDFSAMRKAAVKEAIKQGGEYAEGQ